MLRDLQHAFRATQHRPGFTAVVIVTLALGIGSTTAVFAVVNAVVFRPLPFPDPDNLVMMWSESPAHGIERAPVFGADFVEWRSRSRTLEEAAAFRWPLSWNLAVDGSPERISGSRVTADFFRVLGIEPLIGRVFESDEDQRGRDRVVVLSHGLWQRRFGGDPQVIGRPLMLHEHSYIIIGVLPRGLTFPERTDVWTPLVLDEPLAHGGTLATDRTLRNFSVLARLRSGVTLEQARAESRNISEQLAREYPASNAGWLVSLVPLHEQLLGDRRPLLLMLLGAVSCVLLIACVNLAGLLLARSLTRQKEFAIRTALGCGLLRLCRQVFVEILVLASIGAGLGLLLALWSADVVAAMSLADLGRIQESDLAPLEASDVFHDWRVYAFALGLSVLASIVVGAVPVFTLLRGDLHGPLKESGQKSTPSVRQHQLRSLLVISELALAVVLLVGAGLMLKSFGRLQGVFPGFTAQDLVTLQIYLPAFRYSMDDSKRVLVRDLLDRVGASPGVREVAGVTSLPLHGVYDLTQPFVMEGRSAGTAETPVAHWRAVTPEYFRTMEIRVLMGRPFTEWDTADTPPVVVINETLAHHFETSPVGRRLHIGDGPPREVVGVVGDVKHWGLAEGARPEVYVPYLQHSTNYLALVVRSPLPAPAVGALVRSTLVALDPDQVVFNVRTMEEVLSDSVTTSRISAVGMGTFAVAALLLALLGIYSVLSYIVGQRSQELGIRLALGAKPGELRLMIIRYGGAVGAAGLLVGLAGAFALTRMLSGLLFDVSPTDAGTIWAISGLLGATVLLASYLPARRAAQANPVDLLRGEKG